MYYDLYLGFLFSLFGAAALYIIFLMYILKKPLKKYGAPDIVLLACVSAAIVRIFWIANTVNGRTMDSLIFTVEGKQKIEATAPYEIFGVFALL